MNSSKLAWLGGNVRRLHACRDVGAASMCRASRPRVHPNIWRNGSQPLHRAGLFTSSATRQKSNSLLTLAIETSCDDTSVAILEKRTDRLAARLNFHEKVTSNNLEFRGVHPTVALVSHQQSLGLLVQKALSHLPAADGHSPLATSNCLQAKRLPDFVSVTRGPGMRSNLSVGLDTAKGLSLAWGVPLLAVNHMQAHALTPRLVSALDGWTDSASGKSSEMATTEPCANKPEFPFMSLLVSGGHTLLINSTGLTDHSIIANTIDTAVGDYIDKCARSILPEDVLAESKSAMYGPSLEAYAFPPASDGQSVQGYGYTAPSTNSEAFARRTSAWGWSLSPPFSQGPNSPHARNGDFSFSGLVSVVQKIAAGLSSESNGSQIDAQRRELAREAQRVAFEHLASRVVAALASIKASSSPSSSQQLPTILVVAGGVAANDYLKHILRAYLDARGWPDVHIIIPPASLCTDNAAMIAWTGLEMFESHWRSSLGCQPLRRWGLDAAGADGGILGVGGWVRADS